MITGPIHTSIWQISQPGIVAAAPVFVASMSSQLHPAFPAENGIDGDQDTTAITNPGIGQWFMVDMLESRNVESVRLLKARSNPTRPTNYTIECSDDINFVSGVTTLVTRLNNTETDATIDNVFDFSPVSARYVRVRTVNTSQYLYIAEFVVNSPSYSVPAQKANLHRTVNDFRYFAQNALDGDIGTYCWTLTGVGGWLMIDLKTVLSIESIRLMKLSGSAPSNYIIEIASNWEFSSGVSTILTKTGETGTDVTWQKTVDYSPVSSRFLRVRTTLNQSIQLNRMIVSTA